MAVGRDAFLEKPLKSDQQARDGPILLSPFHVEMDTLRFGARSVGDTACFANVVGIVSGQGHWAFFQSSES